jgi:hypothetical protein
MTDARLGGLGREALVAEAGDLRLGGVVREALVAGTGLRASAGGRSQGRVAASVLFSGIVLSASAKAQSRTRAAASISIGFAGRIGAQSKARSQMPQPVTNLAGRLGGRSQGRMIRYDATVVTGRAMATSRMRGAPTVGPPPILRQYAVSIVS